eukprot:3123061-Prymnesium_polylepis.2
MKLGVTEDAALIPAWPTEDAACPMVDAAFATQLGVTDHPAFNPACPTEDAAFAKLGVIEAAFPTIVDALSVLRSLEVLRCSSPIILRHELLRLGSALVDPDRLDRLPLAVNGR